MARRRQTSKKSNGKSARRGSPTSTLHRYSTKPLTDSQIHRSTGRAVRPTVNSKPRYRRLTVTRNEAPAPPRSLLSPTTFFTGGYLKSPLPRLPRLGACIKRKIRREVIFASGKGGTKVRPPKYNSQSKLRC